MCNEIIRLVPDDADQGICFDENNCVWTKFNVDYFAEQLPGTCAICGKEIEDGWMCLDTGEEICDDHVRVADFELVEFENFLDNQEQEDAN